MTRRIDVSKKHQVTRTFLLDEEVTPQLSLGGAVVKRAIHASHRMGKSFADVRAPAGTPRFYSVRQCRDCEGEEIVHAAGQFTDDDLVKPCYARKEAIGE